MPAVCVFLASAVGADPRFAEAARATGAALAQRGWPLVYGGAHRGLMGILADAALAAGGEVIGVLPRHLQDRELAHRGLTELHIVETMAARKELMMARADGFLALPGGFGTLDELFEVMTAAQLGHHRKPMALYDVAEYFAPLVAWIDGAVEAGLVAPDHRHLLTSHRDLDAALAAMQCERRA